jgi:hypothetical protein
VPARLTLGAEYLTFLATILGTADDSFFETFSTLT